MRKSPEKQISECIRQKRNIILAPEKKEENGKSRIKEPEGEIVSRETFAFRLFLYLKKYPQDYCFGAFSLMDMYS